MHESSEPRFDLLLLLYAFVARALARASERAFLALASWFVFRVSRVFVLFFVLFHGRRCSGRPCLRPLLRPFLFIYVRLEKEDERRPHYQRRP